MSEKGYEETNLPYEVVDYYTAVRNVKIRSYKAVHCIMFCAFSRSHPSIFRRFSLVLFRRIVTVPTHLALYTISQRKSIIKVYSLISCYEG